MATNATEELRDLVTRTTPVQELIDTVQRYPIDLLAIIVREYERRKQPVADHQLGPINYLTGIALRALTEAGLIEVQQGGRSVIRSLVPTEKGAEFGRRLLAERAVVAHPNGPAARPTA